MKRIQPVFLSALTALFVAGTVPALQAEEAKLTSPERIITVEVGGLACPFCAFGLEKKLKRLKGIAKVEILMKEGEIKLHVDEDAELSKEEVAKAVKEAGFEMKGYKDSQDKKQSG